MVTVPTVRRVCLNHRRSIKDNGEAELYEVLDTAWIVLGH